jgi:hypothetical protein
MKRHFAPLFVLAAGCAVDTNLDDVSVTESAVVYAAAPKGCPDPYNCDLGNGGGVYTEEDGFAGIGANYFMITHFIDNPAPAGGYASVTLSGRRWNPYTTSYQVDSGEVLGAWFNGVWYNRVLSVSEDLTLPTWQLSNGGASTPVVGSEMYTGSLQLLVHLNDGTDSKQQYVLAFNGFSTENGPDATIRRTNMIWKMPGAPSYQPYCKRADLVTNDPVVFQQGFAVNAITADFAANNAFVTVACRNGGPPTVRSWGYTYQTTTTLRFQAALHMKRASYCGDNTYYTQSGTNILVYDPVGKQNDITTANYQEIEAVWGPDRALCVNLNKLRHKAGQGPVGWMGTPKFNGDCADGTHINYCTPQDLQGALLASQQNP